MMKRQVIAICIIVFSVTLLASCTGAKEDIIDQTDTFGDITYHYSEAWERSDGDSTIFFFPSSGGKIGINNQFISDIAAGTRDHFNALFSGMLDELNGNASGRGTYTQKDNFCVYRSRFITDAEDGAVCFIGLGDSLYSIIITGTKVTPNDLIDEIISMDEIATAATAIAPPEDDRGLAGVDITEIMASLSNLIPATTPKQAPVEAEDYYAYSASSVYCTSSSELVLDYSILADVEMELIGGTFGITQDTSIPNDEFIELALTYLTYVATMSCADADFDKVTELVKDAIPDVADRSDINVTAGDVRLEIFGTKAGDTYTSFWIDISKK